MNMCRFVWEIPIIEENIIIRFCMLFICEKRKKFSNQLNQYFQNKNMDWKCILDRSACTYDEIFSEENRRGYFCSRSKQAVVI